MASLLAHDPLRWPHVERHTWSDFEVSIQMTLSESTCIGRMGHGTILRTAEFSKFRTLALQDSFQARATNKRICRV